MESLGKFEYNPKDEIGSGSFAVVFKGRHKQRHRLEVAVKRLHKNISKSQSLLGKEIKILKELKHENIVTLLDFQEISGRVYLILEYCNGGDLADYLREKRTLSEDTIRVLLQQIAGALRVLKSKGIIHRDLKPQNILLSYSTSRRANTSNFCVKLGLGDLHLMILRRYWSQLCGIKQTLVLADFGFARFLQDDMMAKTICGSPMYMAPEVLLSQNYDAKADLWSVGTIVYQCLTGKAPFPANTPQELQQLYATTETLRPNIPRETSSQLRHLLLGLLQKNHKERMDFDELFHHPFLEVSPPMNKSSPVPMPLYPCSNSGSSSSGSSIPRLTPTPSDTETRKKRQPRSNTTLSSVSQLKASSSSESDDFVMVPAQFNRGRDSLTHSGASLNHTPLSSLSLRASASPSRPEVFSSSSYMNSVAVPVPTQKQNYQRIEQNQQVSDRQPLFGRVAASPDSTEKCHHCIGGCRPCLPSPHAGTVPKTQTALEPVGSRTDMCHQHARRSPLFTDVVDTAANQKSRSRHGSDSAGHRWDLCLRPFSCQTPSMPIAQDARTKTLSDHKELAQYSAAAHRMPFFKPVEGKDVYRRSVSSGRLSDKLLQAVFLAQSDSGSCESLNAEKPMEMTAPPSGSEASEHGSGSPGGTIFIFGTPELTYPVPYAQARRFSVGTSSSCSPGWTYSHLHDTSSSPDSVRYGYVDARREEVEFVPPELPEETLMEDEQTDLLSQLRFILAFVHCVMEVAESKDCGMASTVAVDASFLEQSMVADQISQLSREWSSSEQLVLYMRCAELLSSALHTAMSGIKTKKLYPSGSVKLVIRRLNDMYKYCVSSCRSLTEKLQVFFSSKQKLMDRMYNITAEKLLYTHAVQMVQTAALDEIFHHGQTPVERYHKALLLMEGLSLIITDSADLSNIDKCKQCIERRLSSLQVSV